MSWLCFLHKGETLEEDKLKNAWDKNPDGGGFAWAENGVLNINKFLSFDSFIEAWRKAPINHNRIISFRWGMVGGKSLDNSQPHIINDNLCLVQTGSLSSIYSKGNKSDTRILIEEKLQDFLKDDYEKIFRPEVQWLLSEFGGSTNKMIFLTRTGKGLIVNSSKGEWDKNKKNVWYSNSEHEYPKYINSNYPVSQSNYNQSDKYYKQESNQKENVSLKPYAEWLKECFDEAIRERKAAVS